MNSLTLIAKIAEIKASGEVAPPNTWLSASVIIKNGKRYTYYRLMEASHKRSKTGKVQGKMLQYLGSKTNRKYQEMRKAIARRNQIQALERQLKRLETLEFPKKAPKRKIPKKPTLTNVDFLPVEQLQLQIAQLMQWFEKLNKEVQQLRSSLKDSPFIY
ncbi:hypothetical protein [Gloeothece verrucosa]|uniref:Uncharacterized protein n=1 Tax=Gloeothece verrucosa (strain PCC 7822) TaxID=497965 RepID=E0UL70_GLOV7|nr:hypothetical protein [Gloeothece verrucosa]ADN17700.1 conserved hypothetical protein [Gloeothece verrucosa PCC 7822]